MGVEAGAGAGVSLPCMLQPVVLLFQQDAVHGTSPQCCGRCLAGMPCLTNRALKVRAAVSTSLSCLAVVSRRPDTSPLFWQHWDSG